MTDSKEPLLPAFEDLTVQLVYDIICEEEAPPDHAKHWDGWVSRKIVAALSANLRPFGRMVLGEDGAFEFVANTDATSLPPGEHMLYTRLPNPAKVMTDADPLLRRCRDACAQAREDAKDTVEVSVGVMTMLLSILDMGGIQNREVRDLATIWREERNAFRDECFTLRNVVDQLKYQLDCKAQEGREPVAVFEIERHGALIEHTPLPAAFDLPDGKHTLYTSPPPKSDEASIRADERMRCLEIAHRHSVAAMAVGAKEKARTALSIHAEIEALAAQQTNVNR